MSTTMYLRCVSHDPYLESGEVGHNTSALPDIRRAIRERDAFLEGLQTAELDLWDVDFGGDQYARNRAWFLYAHPGCDLEIWDEYKQQYSMEDTVAEAPIGFDTVLGQIESVTEDKDGMTVKFFRLTPAGERVLKRMRDA